MTTRAEDQAAEIARLTEALVARTKELAETMAALTVMRARYEHLEDEAEVLAAIARAAIPVVTQPLTDETIGALFATLKAYETWEVTHPARATEVVVVEVRAGIARRHGASSSHKKTTVPKPVVA
jgi:DNA repair exonuclease SbcCD ATPase subunit